MIEKAESQDRTICLIMITYPGLRPGFMYLFRTRGLNVAGAGPWSQETYSVSANCASFYFNNCLPTSLLFFNYIFLKNFTLPVPPTAPAAPRIKKTTLRSIEFAWDEPDDGMFSLSFLGRRIDGLDALS